MAEDAREKNRFLIELSESSRTDFGRVDFEHQAKDQQVFSAIWTLESEVNNGGFLQYFENDRGETATFAPTALRRIGADKCSAIVDRAIATFCGGLFPSDPKKVDALLSEVSDEVRQKLEDLDSQFVEYPDNLTDLLFEFVRRHPATFGIVEPS